MDEDKEESRIKKKVFDPEAQTRRELSEGEREDIAEELDGESDTEDSEKEDLKEEGEEDEFEKEDDLEEQQEVTSKEKLEEEKKEGLPWESSMGAGLSEEKPAEEQDFDDLANIPHVSSINSQISTSVPYPSLNRNPRGDRTKKFHLLILVLIGIVVVGSTVYLLKNSFSSSLGGILKENPSPTPVVVPTSTPSPTPTPVDRATFKISVLNGTSKTGLASTTSSKLKDLGYQTTKVGNATNSSFERTIVRVKPNLLHLAEQLLKDLMPDFDGLSEVSLDVGESDDGVVILGVR